MQALYLDLSTTFRKRYNIEGYGFIIQEAPYDAELYVALNGESSNIVVLNVAKLIRVDRGFRYFDLVNSKAIANERALLYVFENEYDFITYREITQPKVSGEMIDVLNLIHDDTQSIKGNVENIDSTTQDIKSAVNNINANVGDIKDNTADAVTKLTSLDSKIIKADTDNVELALIQAAKQGKAWGYMHEVSITDGDAYEIKVENPASSPTKLYITHYTFKSSANYISFKMYSNRVDDSITELTPFNLNIALSTTKNFKIKQGSFTGGTLLGDEYIDSSNKFTDNILSSGYLILRAGNSLNFRFENNTGNTVRVGLKFYFIEE